MNKVDLGSISQIEWPLETSETSFAQHINRQVSEMMKFIDQNREALIQAWLAETGLKPTESVLCQQTTYGRDGDVVLKCWVERLEK